MPTRELIATIRRQFVLDWRGIHGAPHWARVRENGLRLAEATGARIQVVELFAFLHDSRRENDGHDPDHGARAASFARSLVGHAIELDRADVELLATACEGHSDGHTRPTSPSAPAGTPTGWTSAASASGRGRSGCAPTQRAIPG